MLVSPEILYKDKPTAVKPSGGWNLIGSKFAIAVPKAVDKKLGKWGSLRLKDRNSQGNHGSAIYLFKKNLTNCGMNPGLPQERTLDIEKDKDEILEQTITALHQKKIDILLITLPYKDTGLYNRIKRFGDLIDGIHTVCVIEEKFLECQGAYFGNVALKFNLKLGGINHTLSNTDMGIVSQGKTMVVGIDVVHPSPGSGRASIAAMVGSIDKDLAQWPVDLRIQIREGKEMLDKIRGMINSRLALWKKRHSKYPENILVYRDGVSEGQYGQVLDEELDKMRIESGELYKKAGQTWPRFTLIIVAKRHHTRFFPLDKNVGKDSSTDNRTHNFTRGLVVDRGITEARTWDFFLQSHNALQGTARPAHYVVLWDEIFTNPELQSIHQELQPDLSATDRLQQVTNSMCYLFSRATKAVRIPAPVYYADIACERASRYLAGDATDTESVVTDRTELTQGERERRCVELQRRIEVHEGLRDSMFYV